MTNTPEQQARDLLDRAGVPDAQSFSSGDLVEIANLIVEVERYRWLRKQHWSDGSLCVLSDPKRVLTRGTALGVDCPSLERLDAAIDAAMSAEQG